MLGSLFSVRQVISALRGSCCLEPRWTRVLSRATAQQTAAFRSGAALLERPPEILEIPYETTTLPGYFFRSGPEGPEGEARATVIVTGGYDGTAEELYFANGAARSLAGTTCLRSTGRVRERRCSSVAW